MFSFKRVLFMCDGRLMIPSHLIMSFGARTATDRPFC